MLNSKNIAIAVVIFLATFYQTVWAGPPFVTDDAEPVEAQHWEINNAVITGVSRGDTTVGAPVIDINYGLSPDVQLHLQPSLMYENNSAHKHFGIDDTEIGVKYRFIDHRDDESEWMASIYPILTLPTADKTFNDGHRNIQTFLPLWIQRNSKDWTIYGGAGYRIDQGLDKKNSYFTGITALNHVSDHLQLGGELFHETATEIGGKATAGFNLGGIYDFSGRYHLLLSAGKGLINASSTNQLSTYLALQVTY
ncbi:MAG TPA: transporter [Methylophilaceae bacterium]|jgi:hypothetical protein